MVRVALIVVLAGCGPTPLNVDGGVAAHDAGSADAGTANAGPIDAGSKDAGPADAGRVDAGSADAGPMDAGPTVAAACELGGIWDLAFSGDGGNICRQYAPPPSPLTLTSDGGAVHAAGATGLASDGGCGLTVRFDFPDPSPFDPFNRHHVFSLELVDGGLTGSDRLSVDGFLNCTELVPLTGTRR